MLIPAAGLVVVGAAAAAALVLVLTPRTSVEKMVPASVDVYAVANLDPSVSQKVNLLRAVHRFPDTSTDQKLAQQLDTALKDSGITFTGDIQPWLGAQVALAARIPQGNAEVPVALFVVSRDDAKAVLRALADLDLAESDPPRPRLQHDLLVELGFPRLEEACQFADGRRFAYADGADESLSF